MSTTWSVIFEETLAKYLQLYIEAKGDSAARSQVLKNCQEEIMKSPWHEDKTTNLPQHLNWVSISSH